MNGLLFLIPLFPLLGFLFNFTVGVRALGPKGGHGHSHDHGHHQPPSFVIGLVACGAVLLSFLVAVLAVVAAHAAPDGTLVQTLWTWIPGGAAELHDRRRAVPRGLGLPGRPALIGDGAGGDVRGPAHPRLLVAPARPGRRVHGARPRLRAVHVVPEPLHVRDAHAGAGGQLPGPLHRVGGRRPLLVPADRLLVREAERVRRGQEGLHREPHRGRRLRAGRVPDLHHVRHGRLPRRWPRRRRTCRSSGPGAAR